VRDGEAMCLYLNCVDLSFIALWHILFWFSKSSVEYDVVPVHIRPQTLSSHQRMVNYIWFTGNPVRWE